MLRHEYGGPEVLRFEDLPVPDPVDDQVRIRVHAASVNPADRYHLLGTPKLIQLTDGFGTPRRPGLGIDAAGEVDALGPDATGFAIGDRVFGGSGNAYAEFATLRTSHAAHIPAGVTFQDAATLPVAGCTALQGLRRAEVGAGTRVLVNGASGGVGHFAVQLAKAMGAHVTAVCSTRNLDLVRGLGADEVVDYSTTDYAATGATWDVLFDNHGNHAPSVNRGVLTRGGRWVLVNGPMTSSVWGPMAYIVRAMAGSILAPVTVVQFTAEEVAADLAILAEHVASGAVVPHVERSFALPELADAVRHLATNRTRGKLLVDVP